MSRKVAQDTAAVSGLGLVGVGLWLFSPAASLVVVGVLLIVGALWGHANDP